MTCPPSFPVERNSAPAARELARQGKLAEISRLVAVGSRTKDAKVLLEGAHLAAELELDAVEARCVALAVDFARHAGDSASARVAEARLDSLTATVPSLPIVPSSGTADGTGYSFLWSNTGSIYDSRTIAYGSARCGASTANRYDVFVNFCDTGSG